MRSSALRHRHMPSTIFLPSIPRPVGSQIINIPPTVARRFTACACSVSRESLGAGVNYTRPIDGVVLPNSAFVITMEASIDNVNWDPFYEGVFKGGLVLDRAGNEQLFAIPFVVFTNMVGQIVDVGGDVRIRFQRLIAMTCSVRATMYEPGDLA